MCALFSHPSGLEFDPRKVECDLWEAEQPYQTNVVSSPQHFSLCLINTRILTYCCSLRLPRGNLLLSEVYIFKSSEGFKCSVLGKVGE